MWIQSKSDDDDFINVILTTSFYTFYLTFISKLGQANHTLKID
jgi:hypothetical protein